MSDDERKGAGAAAGTDCLAYIDFKKALEKKGKDVKKFQRLPDEAIYAVMKELGVSPLEQGDVLEDFRKHFPLPTNTGDESEQLNRLMESFLPDIGLYFTLSMMLLDVLTAHFLLVPEEVEEDKKNLHKNLLMVHRNISDMHALSADDLEEIVQCDLPTLKRYFGDNWVLADRLANKLWLKEQAMGMALKIIEKQSPPKSTPPATEQSA